MVSNHREALMEIEFKVQVVIEPDGAGFHAYCPALKGLHVDGATMEEAKENASDAVSVYIDSLIKHNEPIPVGVATFAKRLIPRFPLFFRWQSRKVVEDLVVTTS